MGDRVLPPRYSSLKSFPDGIFEIPMILWKKGTSLAWKKSSKRKKIINTLIQMQN